MSKSKSKQGINASRRSVFMVDCFEYVLIGRDTDHGPEHPRYDKRVHNDFDEDVVLGMLKFGVELPIIVFKNDDGELEVIDGRQRVINAREASRRLMEQGLPALRIGCLPPEKKDTTLRMVLLNEHREPDSAIGRGLKAQQLKDMGYSLGEIAPYFRCSEDSVRNYLSLLNLLPEIQERIAKGETPATVGYKLATKGEKAQQRYLDKLNGGESEEKARPDADKPKPPTKKVLRAMLFQQQLPEDFRNGIRFALGILDPTNVEGLVNVLNPAPESHERAAS